MRYIEALEVYTPAPGDPLALFTAGGIKGCEDWQARYKTMFEGTSLILLNPRRQKFDWSKGETVKQIEWEFDHLKKADAVSFWFSPETLNPISLFELGVISAGNKPLFVGSHPKYEKYRSVVTQMRLRRPGLTVVDSLEELAQRIIDALPHRLTT